MMRRARTCRRRWSLSWMVRPRHGIAAPNPWSCGVSGKPIHVVLSPATVAPTISRFPVVSGDQAHAYPHPALTAAALSGLALAIVRVGCVYSPHMYSFVTTGRYAPLTSFGDSRLRNQRLCRFALVPRGAPQKCGTPNPETQHSEQHKLRIVRVWHGVTENGSLNDGQIPHFRIARVQASTRYNRAEGNRRASRNGLVSDLPPETTFRFAPFASLYTSSCEPPAGRVAQTRRWARCGTTSTRRRGCCRRCSPPTPCRRPLPPWGSLTQPRRTRPPCRTSSSRTRRSSQTVRE
jgi:hypothetical protein